MIRQTAEKERAVVNKSEGNKNKQKDFHKMFEAVSFDKVMRDYMMFTKLLLAKADDADFDTLRTALIINQKMGKRLAAIINLREEEEGNGDVPLAQLMDSISV